MAAVCLEPGADVDTWSRFLDEAVRFLQSYVHLANVFIVDFFVEDLWSVVPQHWRSILDTWSAETLSVFIALPERTGSAANRWWPPGEVPPLSLLSFRAACHALSLPRQAVTSPAPVADFIQRHSSQDNPSGDGVSDDPSGDPSGDPSRDSLSRGSPSGDPSGDGIGDDQAIPTPETWPPDAAAELSRSGGQLTALQHVFRRHVKPKKQHELRRLARLVQLTRPRLVVDLGSGRGHLSRYMAYGCRLPVVCLECNEEFVAGARKLDAELEKAATKRPGQLTLASRPQHASCRITEHMDQRAFAQTLSALSGVPADALQFTPVGLHTCGDLAALQLRQFVRSPQCGAVVSVGCCYMKLSTSAPVSTSDSPPQAPGSGADSETPPPVSNSETESKTPPPPPPPPGPDPVWKGYPLSAVVAETVTRHGYHMTYEAREMACHAIEEYAARLAAGGEQHLKVHAYRAALERALVKSDPQLRHAGLRSVNKAHTLTFPEYVRRAVSRLSGAVPGTEVCPDALDLSRAGEDLSHWRRVVALYSLRLMLAPVIETVLLLDRQLYLWEHGHPSILVPAFDPKMSPRNFVLIGKRCR